MPSLRSNQRGCVIFQPVFNLDMIGKQVSSHNIKETNNNIVAVRMRIDYIQNISAYAGAHRMKNTFRLVYESCEKLGRLFSQ